jgi:hypothetical protein
MKLHIQVKQRMRSLREQEPYFSNLRVTILIYIVKGYHSLESSVMGKNMVVGT